MSTTRPTTITTSTTRPSTSTTAAPTTLKSTRTLPLVKSTISIKNSTLSSYSSSSSSSSTSTSTTSSTTTTVTNETSSSTTSSSSTSTEHVLTELDVEAIHEAVQKCFEESFPNGFLENEEGFERQKRDFVSRFKTLAQKSTSHEELLQRVMTSYHLFVNEIDMRSLHTSKPQEEDDLPFFDIKKKDWIIYLVIALLSVLGKWGRFRAAKARFCISI